VELSIGNRTRPRGPAQLSGQHGMARGAVE
jgi:hypothetical protein